MTHPFLRTIALFWLLTAIFLPLCADEFGNVTVTLEPPTFLTTLGDYYGRSMVVNNRGTETVHLRWEMQLQNAYARNQGESSVFLNREVPPGSTQRFELFIPAAGNRHYTQRFFEVNFMLWLNQKACNVEHWSSSVREMSSYSTTPHFASATLNGSLLEWLTYDNHYQGSPRPTFHSATVPLEQWSRNPLAYAGIRLFLTDAAEPIPPELEAILRHRVQQGAIWFQVVAPEDNHPDGTPASADAPQVESIGWGAIIRGKPFTPENFAELTRWVADLEAAAQNDTTIRSIILGENRIKDHMSNIIEEENPEAEMPKEQRITNPTLVQLQKLLSAKYNSDSQFYSVGDSMALQLNEQSILTLPPLPLRTIFLVMLGFVILIGPVNYFYLKRKKKELHLLWTTPAIALVFCLIVVGFITFSEGWHTRGVRSGMTWLDQTRQEAATIVSVGVYAPLPRGSFQFAVDDAVLFNQIDSVRANFDHGQQVASSILRPRIPLHYQITRFDPAREKLRVVKRDDGTVEVINGLGVELAQLYLIDDERNSFHATEAIPAGARVKLQHVGKLSSSVQRQINRFFPPGEEKILLSALADPMELPTNSFIAVTHQPFLYGEQLEAAQMQTTHRIFGQYRMEAESE